MPEAQTNSGDKLFFCSTPQNEDLEQAAFEALTYVQVKKVGSIGERGISTNIVNYDTLDTVVTQKGKGITDAGSPAVEMAELLNDPGQIALRAAGLPTNKNNYALQVLRSDGTIEYWRGLVTGPNLPGGRNEDFRLNNYTIALNQPILVVDVPSGS